VDTGLFDMLHHTRHDDLFAIAQRINVAFDRVAQILIDQHWRIARHLNCGGDIVIQLGHAVDDSMARPPKT
jgi:hypothetical protein